MRTFKHTLAALVILAMTIPGAVQATNGMYLTSYGAESMGRAGANLAIADRGLALNFNPAGIGQLQGRHFTLNLSVLAPSLEYQNTLNDAINGDDRYFPLPAMAYVRSAKNSPWAFGVGFVAQGGMGATFEGESTFFGTVDQTYTEVRFMTLSPTVSYSFGEDMAIGLALNLGYADASFKFFPETSFFNVESPDQSFFGVNMKQAGGEQFNARLGWWWRANPKLSIGAIYQTETESTYDGGELSMNFTGHPFVGREVMYEAEMEGFTFAAQAGVGIAVRPAERWILALDVKRYFWDHAIDSIVVTARNPDSETAPPEVTLPPFVFNWEDQWIVAFGGDYRLNDVLTLRAGLNYGENPVPDDTLTPLFPATVERHLTFGFSYLRGNKLLEFAVERGFDEDLVNNSTDPSVNPFGPGSAVTHGQWSAGFGVSWALDRRAGRAGDFGME